MCLAELRGLGGVNEEIKRHGGKMFAVSVDQPKESKAAAQNEKIAFPFLCDADRKVITEYGLVHKGGGPNKSDVAIPAHLLIGRDGRILWRHISRKVQDRPDPDEEIETIRRLLGDSTAAKSS